MKTAVQFVSDTNVASKDKTHIMHVYGRVLYNSGNFKEAYRC